MSPLRSLAARATLSGVVAGLVVVVLLAVATWQALVWRSEGNTQDDREAAIAAASAEVEGLIGISGATSDADLKKLLAGATAAFRADLEEQADRLTQEVAKNKVEASGEVVSAGIVKFDDDRATVIVAAAGSVKNKSTKKAEPRNYRLSVDLQRTDGKWLVSGLEFVA